MYLLPGGSPRQRTCGKQTLNSSGLGLASVTTATVVRIRFVSGTEMQVPHVGRSDEIG
jgi:hypothetical protein